MDSWSSRWICTEVCLLQPFNPFWVKLVLWYTVTLYTKSKILPKSGHEEYYEPVTDLESSNDGEDNKPEPKEDVNLLVDNVQR